MSLQTAPTPSLFTEPDTRQTPFYRLYLLQADDHIARRREDYFADDAAAIGAARNVIGDFHGVEIWCGPRKVVTLLREQVARLPTALRPVRAAILISRNKRLLLQARAACRRTEALCARPMAWRRSEWATPAWQHTTAMRAERSRRLAPITSS